MTCFAMLTVYVTALALPAQADSHLSEQAALGAAAFRQCQICHVVFDDEGNKIAGRNAKTGPNLYGVVGRRAGTVEGFRYGQALVSAGEAGLVWDEEQLVQYLLDPRTFLQTYLDDNRARSKMTYRVRADRRHNMTAEDVAHTYYHFLREVGPAMKSGDARAEPNG